MTMHDSCLGNDSWSVSKSAEQLGDLTSSDFDLDLGHFEHIRHVDECQNGNGWKSYGDLSQQQPHVEMVDKDPNNNENCKNLVMLTSGAYQSSACDQHNLKMREIGHISPLHCGTFGRNTQEQSNSSASESLTSSPHLVTSHAEWMNLVASMNLTQLYDGTSTPFQYILGSPTTPATKINEETLTYLNQGQSYEIKLKRLGDLTGTSDTEQYLKSIVRVVFHERRLQYMEREQLETWRRTRPGERILDIDIPLSYGLLDVKIDPQQLSSLEFIWDARREGGIFIKINAISTEFTARRHGGEKGVPFRVQVETYSLHGGDEPPRLLHCASCQVKVFKPKGADRKHKTDREKLDKRSDAEREKYQPSFECTVLSEIPLDQVKGYLEQLYVYKPGMGENQMIKDMAPTPSTRPSTSGVLNSTLGMSLIGQYSSSPIQQQQQQLQHHQQQQQRDAISAFSGVNNASNNVEMPTGCGFASSSPPPPTPSTAPEAVNIYADMNNDRQRYESLATRQRPACINVTVSQGMSFVNMSGSRESMLSQANRKSLMSPMTPNLPSSPTSSFQTVIQSRTEDDVKRTDSTGSGLKTVGSSGCVSQSPLNKQSMTQLMTLSSDSSSAQVVLWLTNNRFENFVEEFQNFSGADLLRLTRAELIQICGLADGIRLDNALQLKNIRPKLTLYVYQESETDRVSSESVRGEQHHSTDSHWDMTSPVGSPSCSSPYSSSPHLSSCSSDPSLTTTNSFSPRITSSSYSYLEKRRGSVQLPLHGGHTSVGFSFQKRRMARASDGSPDDEGSNFRKRQRLRRQNVSNIDGYYAVYLETCTTCHLVEKLSDLFHINVNQICEMYYKGSSGIHILITDSVVHNLVDQGRYAMQVIPLDDVTSGPVRLLLKFVDQ